MDDFTHPIMDDSIIIRYRMFLVINLRMFLVSYKFHPISNVSCHQFMDVSCMKQVSSDIGCFLSSIILNFIDVQHLLLQGQIVSIMMIIGIVIYSNNICHAWFISILAKFQMTSIPAASIRLAYSVLPTRNLLWI